MHSHSQRIFRGQRSHWQILLALAVLLTGAINTVKAQTATIKGSLSQFDVVNETGSLAHGFEIQIEGVSEKDLYYTGFGQRYGRATVVPYATGVIVRWESPYLDGQFTITTPLHKPGAPYSWNDCYLGGSTYATAGCESLGQGMRTTANIVKVTGYWLIEDPQNPGTLTRAEPNVAVPFPVWNVAPVTIVSSPPVVVAEVEAPEPPETPEVYGDAQWMKVYKVQLPREITPEELTSFSPVVPQDPSQVEVAWDLIQASPPSGGNGNRNRNRNQNQGNLDPDTRSVIRRYEMYKYTGGYDAITHEALCADLTCTAPSDGELGELISAQNTAVNVEPDVVIVNRSGNGIVESDDGRVKCGNNCAEFVVKGTTVGLSVNPSGLVFTGWSGGCAGNEPNCSVAVNGAITVGAAFLPQFTLSASVSNKGTVTATPDGNDRGLNCGKACSAKFTSGTTVTLTAVPPAGKSFVNWAGKDIGNCNLSTSPTCNLTITRDTSIQAVFSK